MIRFSKTDAAGEDLHCSSPAVDILPLHIMEIYRKGITAAHDAGIPFLVGGAFALNCYTGIIRHTKDFDFFVMPNQVRPLMEVLEKAGFKTEVFDPVWLAKAWYGDDFIDIIFASRNGVSEVDETWFEFAPGGELLGLPIRLCPVEEVIWSKAFVMERERFDGADIAHLIRARAESMDWQRLLLRFRDHWHVLLVHLILFGFVYPSERSRIPYWVMRELLDTFEEELKSPNIKEKLCRGSLLSGTQYTIDIESWGYEECTKEGKSNKVF